MSKTVKASKFCAKLHEHVGDYYVYGTVGETYNVNKARSLESMYGTGKSMGAGYYCVIENGVKNFYKGKCCKAYGHFAADCSGYMRWARKQLTGDNVSASANGMYGQCSQRGTMDTFPHKPGVLLFIDNGTTANPHKKHVGCYVGGGQVIQASCVAEGIKKGKRTSKWTHWGIPSWMVCDVVSDTYIPADDTTPDADADESSAAADDDEVQYTHMPTLRKGDRGKQVANLQGYLVRKGYAMPNSKKADGTYDGIFGVETLAKVKAFQRARKLTVDGIVGPKTWTALLGKPCN
jgi:cell wall-associated NlpC family hydrolase